MRLDSFLIAYELRTMTASRNVRLAGPVAENQKASVIKLFCSPKLPGKLIFQPLLFFRGRSWASIGLVRVCEVG
jgi:hypothetical protein